MKQHQIIFNQERYTSYDVQKILLDFGSLLWNSAIEGKEINVAFKHDGFKSKKRDYIN